MAVDGSDTLDKYVDGTLVERDKVSGKILYGAFSRPVTTKTSNYTLTTTDYFVLVNATSGAVTITLPTAAGISGREFVIKKIDSSSNVVTVDGGGAETIDGTTTFDLEYQDESINIISNNTNWYII